MASLPQLLPEPELPGWPGEQLREQLAEFAGGLDDRFLRGGGLLSDAIGTIKTLFGALDTVNRALDADAAATALSELRSAAHQIENLPNLLERRDGDLAMLTRLVSDLDGQIFEIRRHLQIIEIYGMNIKIAGAGGDFRIFVDEMTGRLKSGNAEVAVFAQRQKSVLESIGPIRKAYADVRLAQTGASRDVCQQIRLRADGLNRELSANKALADELTALAGQVRESVNRVLAAIQIADSTRQRIEHVVTVFDIVAEASEQESAPRGALDHVARLIGELIEGAAQDHAQQGEALNRSLANLGAARGELAQLISQRTAGSAAGSLADLEAGIAAIGALTERLGETARHADEMLGGIADATDDLVERLDSIDQIVRDVKAIAINTRLLCLRQGQIGVAVAVIAVEVAGQAVRLKQTAAHVEEAIGRLAALNQGMLSDENWRQTDLGTTLDQAREVIATACRQSGEALADGEAVVERLKSQLEEASALVGDSDRLLQMLQPAVSALRRPEPELSAADETWLERVLPRIGALYTMMRERQIHARFALPGTQPAQSKPGPAPVDEPVEQDDDGLF